LQQNSMAQVRTYIYMRDTRYSNKLIYKIQYNSSYNSRISRVRHCFSFCSRQTDVILVLCRLSLQWERETVAPINVAPRDKTHPIAYRIAAVCTLSNTLSRPYRLTIHQTVDVKKKSDYLLPLLCDH
jgi:hypothetical protein